MTTVRFPTKVRLNLADDRLDDPATLELVLDAYGSAIHRSVERSIAIRFVRNARPDPMIDPRVTVRLTGDELPEAVARRLSGQLTGIARAEAARLLARPSASQIAGDRRPTAADASGRGEIYDDARLVIDDVSYENDRYLVPSYDVKGAPAKVGVAGQTQPPAPVPMHLKLKHFTTTADLEAALAQKYGSSPPRRLVVAAADIHGKPFGAIATLDDQGRISSLDYMGEWQIYIPTASEGSARTKAWSFFKADTLRFVQDAPTAEDRRAIRQAEILRRMAEGATEAGLDVTQKDLERLAKQLTRQIPDPGKATRYYNLMSQGEIIQLIEVPRIDLPTEDLPVAVFTVEVPDAQGSGGPGTTGATWGLTECPSLPLEDMLWFNPDPAHAFLEEPPVEWWPVGISANFSNLIEEIAGLVNVPSDRFPGMYLMAAAEGIATSASILGKLIGTGEGGESPRTRATKRLATAFDAMSRLEILLTRCIAMADEGHTLECPLRGSSPSWLLHFYEQYFRRRDRAVKAMFVATCQDVLLEILESSHFEIERRRNNFDAYMQVTRVLILLLLVDVTELTELRESLMESTGVPWTTFAVATAGGPIGAWYESTKTLVMLLERPPVDATSGPPERGRIAQMSDGPRIQDSTGRWWSKAELDSVIAGGREQAFAVDPVLEKLADIPDVVARLRDAGSAGVDQEFKSLLVELKDENEAKTKDVREDNSIAFGLAAMKEAEITSSSSIGAQLAGIHAKADERLRPMFSGNAEEAYVSGMRSLVSSELGYESFSTFFNIVGITAIAILCPPAAFAIGAAQAVYGLSEAYEHVEIQRAMLGGDEILSKAQAEAEMWGAAIGAALVFIPEVPGLVRGARGGVKAIIAGEAREAASIAGRQAVRSAATHLAELAAKDLTTVFVKECLKGYLLNLALQGAIGRITSAVAREVQVSGHASIGDLSQLLSSAISGPPPAPGGAQ